MILLKDVFLLFLIIGICVGLHWSASALRGQRPPIPLVFVIVGCELPNVGAGNGHRPSARALG